MKIKICSKCKKEKTHTEYFKDNRRAIGIRSKCKICCKIETMAWREKNKSNYNNYVAAWRAKNPIRQHKTEIKRRYGLAIEEYNRMLVEQNARCAICFTEHDPTRKRGRLYVDHNHTNGITRALLCGNCNIGMGNFQDSIELLGRAIIYLRRHL